MTFSRNAFLIFLVALVAEGKDTKPRDPENAKNHSATASTPTEECWKDLAGADAKKAYHCIWALVATPAEALACFKARLHPVALPDAARLAQLINDLDSPRFAAREKAMTTLEALGELAGPALQQALARNPTVEVRKRLETLLDKVDAPLQPGETLQTLRAIEVLEHIGNHDSEELLRKLAAGAPGARATREAKASLERLARKGR